MTFRPARRSATRIGTAASRPAITGSRAAPSSAVEADWSWANNRASATYFDGDAGTQDAITIESRMRWFGTVRARTGVVVDNVLLYVTGGLAYRSLQQRPHGIRG